MRTLKSQQGQSLIQMVIAVGIMSVLILTFGSMMVNQQNQVRNLKESLGALDLQTVLTRTMGDGTVCHYLMNNPVPRTFDSTAVSPTTPQKLAVPRIYSVASASAPVIAEVGKPASALGNTPVISSIALSIHSGAGATYNADWIIEFEPNETGRRPRPIAVASTIVADTTVPTAATIAGCMGTAPTPTPTPIPIPTPYPAATPYPSTDRYGGMYTWHRRYNRCERSNPYTGGCSCPSGYTAQTVLVTGNDDGSPYDDQTVYACYR